MSKRYRPIVPHIAVFGDRRSPYEVPPLEKVAVRYSTACFVAADRGHGVNCYVHLLCNQPQPRFPIERAYCLSKEQDWKDLTDAYENYGKALSAVVVHLQTLKTYSQRLQEAGGFDNAPSRLCETVILTSDPNHVTARDLELAQSWEIPQIQRIALQKHTPQMLRYADGQLVDRTGHFYCPDTRSWQKLQQLRRTAVKAFNALNQVKQRLGTYQEAIQDSRYSQQNSLFQSKGQSNSQSGKKTQEKGRGKSLGNLQ